MKKISKPVTKEKLTKIKDNLFTENVILSFFPKI